MENHNLNLNQISLLLAFLYTERKDFNQRYHSDSQKVVITKWLRLAICTKIELIARDSIHFKQFRVVIGFSAENHKFTFALYSVVFCIVLVIHMKWVNYTGHISFFFSPIPLHSGEKRKKRTHTQMGTIEMTVTLGCICKKYFKNVFDLADNHFAYTIHNKYTTLTYHTQKPTT